MIAVNGPHSIWIFYSKNFSIICPWEMKPPKELSGYWKIQSCIYRKSEYRSNVSFIKLGDDSTGLRMGYLTLEAYPCSSLSLIMLSFPVLKERDAIGKVHPCAVCPESSGALKGVLGENLHVVSKKDVCIHCCLHWYKPKSCDLYGFPIQSVKTFSI